MKYLLTIIAKTNDQDEFVRTIANEISLINEEKNVKYFYTQESIFITFESASRIKELEEFFYELFLGLELLFVLNEFHVEQTFTNMTEKTILHLFEDSLLSEKYCEVEKTQTRNEKIDEEILNNLLSIKEHLLENETKLFNTPKPSLNDLLDKINISGLTNLTKEELYLLNEYSKSI